MARPVSTEYKLRKRSKNDANYSILTPTPPSNFDINMQTAKAKWEFDASIKEWRLIYNFAESTQLQLPAQSGKTPTTKAIAKQEYDAIFKTDHLTPDDKCKSNKPDTSRLIIPPIKRTGPPTLLEALLECNLIKNITEEERVILSGINGESYKRIIPSVKNLDLSPKIRIAISDYIEQYFTDTEFDGRKK